MADLSDVESVLASSAAALLYPAGTGSPSAVGVAVKVYPGWPNGATLDADLRATVPTCHVSIYPRPEERNTTRYSPADWKQVSKQTPALVLAIVGQTVTLSGVNPGASNPHVLALIVNGLPYVYAVLPADTLATAATALAALVPGATAAGAVVTMPASARLLAARVAVTGTSLREVRRQERLFQIAVWADTPAHRDAISQLLDAAFADLRWLTMPDGTGARLIYKSSAVSDMLQKDCLYRRDLFYTVEYATTITEVETQIAIEQLNLSAAVAGVLPYVAVSTNYG